MRYQLIVFDMDGTLLDGAKRVLPSSVDAIGRALAAGLVVAIGSGRCPGLVACYAAELPGVRYAICSSGATLYDLAERRVLARHSIEPSLIARLRELAAGTDFSPDAFSGRDFYYPTADLEELAGYGTGAYVELFREAGIGVDDVWETVLGPGVAVEKIDLHFSNLADRDVVRDRIQAEGLALELAYSDSTTLEVSPGGVNKGTGLAALAGLLGVPMEATIAVGDSNNDLPMLAMAGLAVGMGNANARVREAAGVLVADNNHDGCAEAIDRYLLAD